MTLKEQLQEDMKNAMRAKDTLKLGTVRMLISEVKKREIDSRTTLDNEGVEKIIKSFLKQRQDSIEAFVKGGRQDLADQEKAEIDILTLYLPKQMDAAEIEKLVVEAINESGAKAPGDIGKVMKLALAKSGGKADGKLVNEIARGKLST